jgi:RNA polymerase sigma-70 factor (ECF subfamily)
MSEPSLYDTWLAALQAGGRPRDPSPDAAEAELRSRLDAARATWQDVAVPDPLVLRRVAAVLEPGGGEQSTAQALGGLRLDGLYLAAGCLAGIPAAVDRVREILDHQVDLAIAQMPFDAQARADLKQQLRANVLVGGPDPPKLQSYAGRGDLRAWLGVCATRLALTALREAKKGRASSDEELLALATPGDDPETRYLKDRYGTEFRAAFADALASLASDKRAVLRWSFLDDLSIDQIGALLGVSRATAARRVRAAQNEILSATREALARRISAGPAEVDSILRMLESRIDLAASQVRAAFAVGSVRESGEE